MKKRNGVYIDDVGINIKLACSFEMTVPKENPYFDNIFCFLFYRMKKERAQRLERNKEAF